MHEVILHFNVLDLLNEIDLLNTIAKENAISEASDTKMKKVVTDFLASFSG